MTAHTAAARGLFTQPTTLTHTLPPDHANAKVSQTLTRNTTTDDKTQSLPFVFIFSATGNLLFGHWLN